MNKTTPGSRQPGRIFVGAAYKGLEFRQRIGEESGMGDVWLAFQPAVQREVAVKVIRRSFSRQVRIINGL